MGVTFNRFLYTALITILLLQLLFCSSPEYAGGVETTNGITVAIKQNQIQGIAPVGSHIVLCDSAYAAYKFFEPFIGLYIDTAVADASGRFKFENLTDGVYNLTGRNFNSDSGAIITYIGINHQNSTEVQRSAKYAMLGSISGTVIVDSFNISLALVYVMGTDLRDTTDDYGRYTVEHVPPGNYKITGSCNRVLKPGLIEYYVSIENVMVPENRQVIGADLKLEKIN